MALLLGTSTNDLVHLPSANYLNRTQDYLVPLMPSKAQLPAPLPVRPPIVAIILQAANRIS